MQFITQLKYPVLYRIWAGLFALTAVLGLCFPDVEHAAGRFALQAVTVCFFFPPWLILVKAKQSGALRHVKLLRYLSAASLGATLVFLCAGILSVRAPEALGNLLHILMTVICAPLVCSNYYVLPMFLWATLLVGSFGRKK